MFSLPKMFIKRKGTYEVTQMKEWTNSIAY